MNDKKNIDRLFQEKFKDFEVTPDEAVWEKIKARQKNRKRAIIIPLWYKVGGVAALLAIIFTVGYMSLTPDSKTETIVSNDTENTKEIRSRDSDTIDVNPINTVIVSSENEEINTSDNDSKRITPGDKSPTKTRDRFDDTNRATASNSEKEIPESLENKKDKESRITDNAIKKVNQPTPFSPKKDEDEILKNNTKDKTTITNHQDLKSEKENPLFTIPKQEDNTDTKGIAENKINTDEKTEKNDSIPGEVKPKDDLNKKSIFDVISEKEETIAEETSSSKKWNVAPNIAPVYYNSIGNGSSIDSQFADNNKGGEVNLSYGVQISYNINERLSVRSGVNKVDLSYNTQDIGFSPSGIVGQNLASINYDPNADAILVSDIGAEDTDNAALSDINRDALNSGQNVGLLNQRIGYIEIPMEMKYALVNKKLGVNMIGGVSTLLLQDNEISVEAGDFETPIGEANNLNNVSFSGNIGVGIDYKLSDQFQINLEPIFKYQFNAFNGNTENFRPYYFGIYTGVSIKF